MEIGEYVRTSKGYILENTIAGHKDIIENIEEYDFGKIVNHGKSIKELVEEKDILRYRLNNLSAIKIGEVKKYREARTRQEYLGVGGFGLEQIEILSIVTKERFKESEYVVN